MYGDMLW